MHTVIRNAWQGNPYPIDTLFMYMANMAWNSSMNTTETISMLTDTDADGNYKIPFIIYSDAYYSEPCPLPIWCPDTTYLGGTIASACSTVRSAMRMVQATPSDILSLSRIVMSGRSRLF